MRFHLLAIAPAFVLAACGNSDDNDVPIPDDAPVDAPVGLDGEVDSPGVDAPTGPDFPFVIAAINIPQNAAEAMTLGLDIDGRANDGVDNQLGMILGALSALAPDLDVQASTDVSVVRGETIVLALLRGMLDGGGLTMRTFEGINPVPAACTGPSDSACGHHLEGNGSFDLGLAASSVPIGGLVTANIFRGDGGAIAFPVGLGANPVWVELHRAKAELFTLTPTTFEGKLGGAVTVEDINTQVIPASAVSMRATFDRDCTVGGQPPGCDCAPSSTGETLRGLFDRTPADCQITDAEVQAVMSGFLTPDIDLDLDGVNDALSIGVGVRAVRGSFTSPN